MVFTQCTIGIENLKTFKIRFNSQFIDDLQVSNYEDHQMSIVRGLKHGWGTQNDALPTLFIDSNVNLKWKQRKSKELGHAPLFAALSG